MAEARRAPKPRSSSLIAQPDTRAYFKSIQDRILELEALGTGAGDEVEDEEGDERAQLIRGSLQQLSGHEIELAVDAESAIVLERLTHSMDDFARRVLADRFAGQYAALAKHPFASHVIQTLLIVSAKTIDREVRQTIPLHCSFRSAEGSSQRLRRARATRRERWRR